MNKLLRFFFLRPFQAYGKACALDRRLSIVERDLARIENLDDLERLTRDLAGSRDWISREVRNAARAPFEMRRQITSIELRINEIKERLLKLEREA